MRIPSPSEYLRDGAGELRQEARGAEAKGHKENAEKLHDSAAQYAKAADTLDDIEGNEK